MATNYIYSGSMPDVKDFFDVLESSLEKECYPSGSGRADRMGWIFETFLPVVYADHGDAHRCARYRYGDPTASFDAREVAQKLLASETPDWMKPLPERARQFLETCIEAQAY